MISVSKYAMAARLSESDVFSRAVIWNNAHTHTHKQEHAPDNTTTMISEVYKRAVYLKSSDTEMEIEPHSDH